jgi:hypothetical protein
LARDDLEGGRRWADVRERRETREENWRESWRRRVSGFAFDDVRDEVERRSEGEVKGK